MVLKAKTTRRENQQKASAIDEATKEETIRLNADIPVRLHQQLKIRAVQERCSLTEIVTRVLNDYLSK